MSFLVNPYRFSQNVYSLDKQIGILLIAQSNGGDFAHGGTPPSYLQAAIDGAYIENGNGNFDTLKYLRNNAPQAFGPELSLCYELVREYERPVFYAGIAKSGAPLASESGRADFNILFAEPAIDLYQPLLQKGLLLKQRIESLGKTPVIIALVIQGERDCGSTATAMAWRNNYQDLVNKLRTDGVPIDYHIVNILKSTQAAGTQADRDIVIANQLGFVAANSNAFALDMNPYTLGPDGLHYTGDSQIAIGQEIKRIIFSELFNGGPELPSASYSAAARTALKVYRPMPTAYSNAIAAFVDSCVARGNWSKIRVCQVRGLDIQGNALMDLKNVSHAKLISGTFTPKMGITYNGTSDYMDLRFNPNLENGGVYQLNSAFFGWFIKQNLSAVDANIGGIFGSSSFRANIAQTPSLTRLLARVNDVSGFVYMSESVFANNSLYIARRTGATAEALLKNGTVVATGTTSSNGLPEGPLFEGALDNLGTASSFINAQVGMFIAGDPAGFDFPGLNTDVATLMTALAAI